MSEEVLGIIRVDRPAFYEQILEFLIITPNRVLISRPKGGVSIAFSGVGFAAAIIILGIGTYTGVIGFNVIIYAIFGVIGYAIGALIDKARRKKKKLPSTVEELLKAEHRYAILNSKITKIELKKSRKAVKLNIIITSKGKFRWTALGLDIKKKDVEKDVKLEDYENMLRPIFGNKLSVKK